MSTDKLIVITQENTLKNEADLWVQLLKMGVGKIHVRKPGMKTDELLKLVNTVPLEYRKQLIIHQNPQVTLDAGAGGLHLPFRHIIDGKISMPVHYSLSASTHNWQEAEKAMKLCSYCFISPVFNSISKTGYNANPELASVPVHLKGARIYALGGIHGGNIQSVLSMGYYGAAVLGAIWNNSSNLLDITKELLDVITNKEMAI